METGTMDVRADLLKKAINKAREQVQKQFKGVKPFRKEKMPDDEVIARYIELLPHREQLRMTMPGWGEYEQKVLKLIGRK